MPRKSELGLGRAGGNQSSRPWLHFELPFKVRVGGGQGKGGEGRRILPVHCRFLQFSKVSFQKEEEKRRPSVQLALYAGSCLPAPRSPRHLNSLSTTRSGLSAVAGRSCWSRGVLPLILNLRGGRRRSVQTRGGNRARRGGGLWPRAAGAPSSGRQGRSAARPAAARAPPAPGPRGCASAGAQPGPGPSGSLAPAAEPGPSLSSFAVGRAGGCSVAVPAAWV